MKRFTCLIPAVLLSFFSLASSAEPDAESLLRLSNGEILLLDATSNESGGSARVQVLVQSSAEAVWDVITSCEQSFVFVDGLKRCAVIEDSGHSALVHQVVKKAWFIPGQDFVFESRRAPFRSMRFELVEGNLKALEGSWDFSEIPEGLLVEYQIRVRPVFPVPGFIVSYVMRRGMPDLIACIRGLAGGSGSSEKEKEDLDRCRGDAAGTR